MKTCKHCHESKDISHFVKNGYSRKGTPMYKPICKECYPKVETDRFREYVHEFYKTPGVHTWECSECGFEGHPVSFDCHHRDPSTKSFGLSEARRGSYSKKRILDELEKCELLCANCHRLEHAEY